MSDANQIEKIDLNKVDWRSSKDFFQSLEDELRSLDDKEERYDFTWVGKRKAIIEAGAPINKTLRPDMDSSKNWDTTQNLFIEGDNLDALKLLQESYLGKVKMIYIDPPYNTGKDFVYHDNFKANIEEYDEASEYKDEEGNIQFKKNEKTNGRYHSDWLSMMYPRLKLARNLLTEDGVIFISIDDYEFENLHKLCTLVFSDENVSTMIWHKSGFGRYGKMKNTTTFRIDHEYVICCFRNIQVLNKTLAKPNFQNEYGNADKDPRGNYKAGSISKREDASNPKHKNYYTVTSPSGKKFTRQFDISEEEFNSLNSDILINENGKRVSRIFWGMNDDSVPSLKIFTDEKRHVTTSSILQVGTTNEGSDEFNNLLGVNFGGEIRPKPVKLIERLIQIGTNTDSITMDFFAGSGTTAHAVMQLNAEDGGNRKWIMVQLPEETPEDSEARKADYKNIPEIARERIRRAGDKIAKEFSDANVDYGFRSLVIADSNVKDVYKPAGEVTQQTLLEVVDNIKEDRTDLDLLYGVLTQLALELNRPLETREITGSTVYLYDYLGETSGLIACFSDVVSEEAIKEIAALKPLTAVFRDSSFEDSQAKVNLAEHFRVISPNTKVRVI